MLKSLRNRMLIINMVSTFCLLLVSFFVIFAVTYSSVQRDIDRNLFRAFSMHRPAVAPEEEKPSPFSEHPRKDTDTPEERHLGDIRNFSVVVFEDGTVETDSLFGENSEVYRSVAEYAAKQKKTEGRFKSEEVYWQYDTHLLGNGARIIALADVTAEYAMLVRLAVSFALCAVLLLVLIFFFSLFFANRAMRPVSEAWEKQKRFVADASHELKTPLAAINANVDAVLANAESTVSEQKKWLRHIKSEAQRLSQLTNNLLFMARMDARSEIPTENVNLSETAEEVALNFEATAFERGIHLEYFSDRDSIVKGDKNGLYRLVVILLDNAVKYSPNGETVTVAVKKEKKCILLSVHNTGSPIPPDKREKIFDRFYRADESRTGNSYGLGLAMAREITTRHGGKIWVESDKENGTVFYVKLDCVSVKN